MFYIIYELVCRENFFGDEVCCIVKKVENHWVKLLATSLKMSSRRSLFEIY
jgi:hypothetical protein